MAELAYQVFMEGEKMGTTALEKADTPMGVVFGRLLLSNITNGYHFFKNYCLEKMIGIADYPESQLISTRNLPGLQVFNPNGTEIKAMSASVSGQGKDDFEITLEGITAGLFYDEFPHNVTTYQETLGQSVIKRYKILESLPAYGPMYIPITASGEPFYSEGYVVRFIKTDNTQWIANFQPGWTDLKGIFELRAITNLLVIADGTCYLMNPDQEKPLAAFGDGYTTVLTAKDGRLILINVTDCTIVELNGSFWHTERISWDGIKDAQLTDNTVSGWAYNPTHDSDEWVSFYYNIDTKELLGGSYPKSAKTKKSKWRFW